MNLRPTTYTHKGVSVPRWLVVWMEKGRQKRKRFKTEQRATAWMKVQKTLLSGISENERADWNAIPIQTCREILALMKECADAGIDSIPWKEIGKTLIEKKNAPGVSLLFKDVITDILAGKVKKHKKGNLNEKYLYITTKCFEKIKADWGGKHISETKWEDIEAWLNKRYKGKTFNDYHARFNEIYRWARRDHPMLINPMFRIEKDEVKPEEKPVPSPVHVKNAFLAAIAEKNWILVGGMTFAGGLGIRSAEIGKLPWEWVQNNLVRLTKAITKNKDARNIERCPEFEPIFEILELVRGKGMVVQPRWNKQRLRVLAKCEVDSTRNILRKSFVSYYVAFTPRVEDVRKVIGHSTSSDVLEKCYRSIDLYDKDGTRALTKADAQEYFAMFREVRDTLAAALQKSNSA